jgi:sterol desaturase/sphingolipid hydroxylase (fatty acid hydroxylase superfamily)
MAPYVFWGALMCGALAETFFPLRELALSTSRRWLNHGALLAINTAINILIFRGGSVAFAAFIDQRKYGVLRNASLAAAFVVTFLALDLARYVSHRLHHRMAVLWRIHQVHHADPDFDITTGFRFHPLEAMLTECVLFAVILALGPPVAAVLIAESAATLEDLFEHVNVPLPDRLDRLLRMFVVTPNMHRIHHSADADEQNTNFGTVLTWWDRLFGTYAPRASVDLRDMQVGLADYPASRTTSIASTLAMPFTD